MLDSRPETRAVSVHAHLDGTTTEYTRRGRLMLMPVGDTWKIFGYDLSPGGGL